MVMLTSGYPVEAGLADSLAKPGRNLTGNSIYAELTRSSSNAIFAARHESLIGTLCRFLAGHGLSVTGGKADLTRNLF